jgi:FlaA1/EpsC-like NDP-sugar epimerase
VEIDGQFDIVASLAVIEHVEDPLSFMRWLRDRVAPGGILLLTCPDFALNPNDLLCVDHLSKFTLPQLEMVARRAGLAVVRLTHVGIAMVVVLQQVLPSDAVAGVRDFTSSVVRGNEAKAQAMIACIGRAQRAATRDGTRMAIFGLGMTGLFAPMVEGFPRSEIAAYIDENPTMHGQRIEGVPIVDLHEIPGLGIGHVALSVSPIYQDQVIDKLGPFGVTIHV